MDYLWWLPKTRDWRSIYAILWTKLQVDNLRISLYPDRFWNVDLAFPIIIRYNGYFPIIGSSSSLLPIIILCRVANDLRVETACYRYHKRSYQRGIGKMGFWYPNRTTQRRSVSDLKEITTPLFPLILSKTTLERERWLNHSSQSSNYSPYTYIYMNIYSYYSYRRSFHSINV